jgi:hypothetical protein
MQIAILNRWRYPATPHCEVPNAPGKDERKDQRYSENDQVERRQFDSPQLKAQNAFKQAKSSAQATSGQARLHSCYSSKTSGKVVWIGRTITTRNPEFQSSSSVPCGKLGRNHNSRQFLCAGEEMSVQHQKKHCVKAPTHPHAPSDRRSDIPV